MEAIKGLMRECIAEPYKRTNLTDEEVKDLAQKRNKEINLPLISEAGEEKVLIKFVYKIDRFLSENLPDEFYNLVRSTDK